MASRHNFPVSIAHSARLFQVAALLSIALCGACEGEKRFVEPSGNNQRPDDKHMDAGRAGQDDAAMDAGVVTPSPRDAARPTPTPGPDAGLAFVDAGRDAGDADALDADLPVVPEDGFCFEGKLEVVASAGMGTCAEPFVIDLSGGAFDDTVYVLTPSGGTDEPVSPLSKCGEDLARDLVFVVTVPDQTDLEVTVAAMGDGNPVLLAQDGPNSDCAKGNTVLCQDEGAAGECEYTRLKWGSDAFAGATTQLIVSEAEGSGSPLVVHLRLRDPGGGA